MKTIVLALAAVLTLNTAYSQETTQFTVNMTGTQFFRGEGTFSLNVNLLSYNVRSDFGLDRAVILGPGDAGNESVLFNLHLRLCNPPLPPDRGGCFYQGTLSLSEPQINDLLNGQWSVYSYDTSDPNFYYLRGPIIPVPEPSLVLLLGLAFSLAFLLRAFLRRSRTPRWLASSC